MLSLAKITVPSNNQGSPRKKRKASAPPQRILAIEGGAGLGKSSEAMDEAVKKGLLIEVYVPTQDLAQEAAKRLEEKHPTVTTTCIRGRCRVGDDGETPMCNRSDVVRPLNNKGVHSVYSLLCRKGTGEKASSCEHYNECDYIQQFQSDAQVRFYPHVYLTYPRSQLDDNKPDLIIIDETFLSVVEGYSLQSNQTKGEGECMWQARQLRKSEELFQEIIATLISEKPILPSLRDRFPDLLDEVNRLLDQYKFVGPAITPDMNSTDCIRAVEELDEDAATLTPLLEVLKKAIELGAEDTQTIWYDPDRNVVCANWIKPLPRLQKPSSSTKKKDSAKPSNSKDPSILILDAAMNIDAIRKIFGEVEHHIINPTRRYQGQTIQVYNSLLSRNRLLSTYKKSSPSKKIGKANSSSSIDDRKAIERKIKKLTKEMGGGLIVGYKDFMKKLVVPKSCEKTHFGNLRGKNEWKLLNWVVIIGRHQFSTSAYENQARAYYGNDDPPLNITGGFKQKLVGYKIRSHGKHHSGVYIDYHEDERVQNFVYQYREAETEQAIDRVRLIFNDAKSPKPVYIISNLPVNVKIDLLMTFDEWTDEAPHSILHQVWREGFEVNGERIFGVLPLNPKWLWENVSQFRGIYPKHTPTRGERRVKGILEGVKNKDEFPYIYSIWNVGLIQKIEISGKTGAKNRCLSLFGKEETERVLKKILGEEFFLGEGEGESGTAISSPKSHRTISISKQEESGTAISSPKVILTHSISSHLSQLAMNTAHTTGLVRGGWCQSTEAIKCKGTIPGRYPLFDANTDNLKEVLSLNIQGADGVLMISNKFESKWIEERTHLCEKLNRPHLVVSHDSSKKTIARVKNWIQSNEIQVLFILGAEDLKDAKYTSAKKLFRKIFSSKQNGV
jgi:hypothetical protein